MLENINNKLNPFERILIKLERKNKRKYFELSNGNVILQEIDIKKGRKTKHAIAPGHFYFQ
jgi:hypothetical protein